MFAESFPKNLEGTQRTSDSLGGIPLYIWICYGKADKSQKYDAKSAAYNSPVSLCRTRTTCKESEYKEVFPECPQGQDWNAKKFEKWEALRVQEFDWSADRDLAEGTLTQQAHLCKVLNCQDFVGKRVSSENIVVSKHV